MATLITKNQFNPDYATHPGEVLEEILEAKGISKVEFAQRAGLSPKTVSLIVAGIAPVTPENAVAFEGVLGVRAEVWNNLDSNFRLFEAKRAALVASPDTMNWAKRFPLAELASRGAIANFKDIRKAAVDLLRFFRVKDIMAWKAVYGNPVVAFRKSPTLKSSHEAVVAWLRLAEIEADSEDVGEYDTKEFKAALKDIRKLTDKDPQVFEPKMRNRCKAAGVALAFVAELPKTRLSGAASWLGTGNPMIALSLRHKTNDHFWFTFFHEAGHILKHGKKDIFIDEEKQGFTKEEDEANSFASSYLIPDEEYNTFTAAKSIFLMHDVERFAKQIGIAPGIIVGRLQHDRLIPYRRLNELKVSFKLV